MSDNIPVVKNPMKPAKGIMFRGLEIDAIEFEGIDTNDYPDFVDAYVSYAEWPNGSALTDSDLEAMQEECQDELYEMLFNQIF